MSLDLCFTPPSRLARLIRARKLSATELIRAFIAQIERVNPKVNAIVTFLPELALRQAKALDRKKPNAEQTLWGLPIAYKDVVPTRGIRTTYGSPIYRDHVPAEDHLIVERLAAAGAITIGKTNTPEFAAGSQTFNAVFGATLNPYDLSRTCGGSSGGAAAAVACGMLPFADGSDLGASLRNPGNFCNVVGFRPTPGRVPGWPATDAWQTLTVIGTRRPSNSKTSSSTSRRMRPATTTAPGPGTSGRRTRNWALENRTTRSSLRSAPCTISTKRRRMGSPRRAPCWSVSSRRLSRSSSSSPCSSASLNVMSSTPD